MWNKLFSLPKSPKIQSHPPPSENQMVAALAVQDDGVSSERIYLILHIDLGLNKLSENVELTILAINAIFTEFIDILPQTFTHKVCIYEQSF